MIRSFPTQIYRWNVVQDIFEDTKEIKFDCLILFQTQIWKSENKTLIIVKAAETKFNGIISIDTLQYIL